MFFRRSTGSALPGGSPLVLVHGLGLSGRYMLPVAEALARHHPVYLPDLPGFGDSAKPDRALDVPGLAEALAGWIRAAGLEPVALLGNSFGCQIIADLAARHPRLVERAVLQGPTTPPQDRSWLRQFVVWRQNQPFNPDSLSPITWGDYRKCGYRRLLLTFHYQLKDRIEDKLPQIRAPVLVVRGQLDPICGTEWAAEIARRLPDGRHVEIPDVAHTLVYTAPEELAAVTRLFLDEAATRSCRRKDHPERER
jgi:pimeloyl-ACP methyl ester carboxylesterase